MALGFGLGLRLIPNLRINCGKWTLDCLFFNLARSQVHPEDFSLVAFHDSLMSGLNIETNIPPIPLTLTFNPKAYIFQFLHLTVLENGK
jgi:hypothetical protein